MNEGQKTGLFWVVAAAMLIVALLVAWPASQRQEVTVTAGKPLFEEFKDPMTASNLRIVTFDDEQGQIETFEVRRDRETGEWTIPSRSGYPADAVEQMKNAANSLVGLQILDIQTRSPEDHEALGVVEPKLESLEVGDIGVGRLVTFKDDAQKTLAALILGKPVKGEEDKLYVRKPGQDPVYVVKLEQSALSTKFEDWIEEDLLQLSSIDIKEMAIKDYSASMDLRAGVSLNRNYTAEVSMKDSVWQLDRLLEFPSRNPMAEPKVAEIPAGKKVNADKLNDMKNALDDLKIADVVRKPDGMSANLRADKDLISDNEAVASLASRGFFPVSMGADSEFEVLSANGELAVTLNDGVEYVLRFGNVSGLADETTTPTDEAEESAEETGDGGVNRYLLVTARVDEEQFPAPELQPVPQTIAELEAMLGAKEPSAPAEPEPAKAEPTTSAAEEPANPSDDGESEAPATMEKPGVAEENEAAKPVDESEADMKAETKEPTVEAKASADTKPESEKPASEKPTDGKPNVVEEVTGEGAATGEGQGQDEPAGDQSIANEEPATDAAAQSPAASEENSTEPTAESPSLEPAANAPMDEDAALSFADLSDDEKQERLEAEQEKILKENTRRLDARKDQLNKARRRVSDLNARFADWYYVIPETTYAELRIQREELLVDDAPAPPTP